MIRVYTGTGTSRYGSPLLLRELTQHQSREAARIDEHEMRSGDAWKKETSVLIFAGQSVTKFKEALGEDVQRAIRDKVFEGAFDYIGICAGAAFGSAYIRYRMKPLTPSQQPLIRNTGLGLFNGLASGPSKSVSRLPFSGGPENLHLITVRDTEDLKNYNVFHWGGPSLISLTRTAHRQESILSVLPSDGTAMSLRLKHGAGQVTLCSYHPEIHAGNIGEWAEKRFLSAHEAERLESLAQQLDGTAFPRFLRHAGLASKTNSAIKMAAKAAILHP